MKRKATLQAQALNILSGLVKKHGEVSARPRDIRALANTDTSKANQCPFANLQSHNVRESPEHDIKRVYDEDGRDWWVSTTDPRPAEYRKKFRKKGWNRSPEKAPRQTAVRVKGLKQDKWEPAPVTPSRSVWARIKGYFQ